MPLFGDQAIYTYGPYVGNQPQYTYTANTTNYAFYTPAPPPAPVDTSPEEFKWLRRRVHEVCDLAPKP